MFLTNCSPDKAFVTCLVNVPVPVPAKEWPIPSCDNYWCEAAKETNPITQILLGSSPSSEPALAAGEGTAELHRALSGSLGLLSSRDRG